jgi:hypothetical protein
MRVGDLVRVKPSDSDIRDRTAGVVINFDIYCRDKGNGPAVNIVEVLWGDKPSWITKDRIEVISEGR